MVVISIALMVMDSFNDNCMLYCT